MSRRSWATWPLWPPPSTQVPECTTSLASTSPASLLHTALTCPLLLPLLLLLPLSSVTVVRSSLEVSATGPTTRCQARGRTGTWSQHWPITSKGRVFQLEVMSLCGDLIDDWMGHFDQSINNQSSSGMFYPTDKFNYFHLCFLTCL